MKTNDLVIALIETIRGSVRLKIIALVCDQAPTNVSALNILTKKTIENYTRRGIKKETLDLRLTN